MTSQHSNVLQIPFNRRERQSLSVNPFGLGHPTRLVENNYTPQRLLRKVLSEMRILQEPALLYNTPFPTSHRCIKQAEGRNGNVNTAKWDADLEHRNNIQLDEFRNLNLRSVLKPLPPASSTQTHTGTHREIFRQAQPIDSRV